MTSNRLSGLALRLLQQTVIWREDERHSEVICTAPSKENEAILHAGRLHVPPFYSLFIKLQSKGIYCTNVPKVGVATQKFPDALRAPLVEPPFLIRHCCGLKKNKDQNNFSWVFHSIVLVQLGIKTSISLCSRSTVNNSITTTYQFHCRDYS